MAIGSGVGGSVGFAPEATYGTYVAPGKWMEVNSFPLQFQPNYVQGGGLAAGRLFDPGSQRVLTTRAANGTVGFNVVQKGLGQIWNLLFGGTVVPVQQAATPAYLASFTPVDIFGKSMSMQVNKPDRNGVNHPYTYLGVTATSATFECETAGLLTCSMDLDGRDITEAQTLVAPSFPPLLKPFHGGQMGVRVGAVPGSEVAVQGVTKMNVKIDRNTKVDSYYANNAGLKAAPVINATNAVSGVISRELVDKTVFSDRFYSSSSFSLVWEFIDTSAPISGTYYPTFRLRLPQCFIEDDPTNLDGEDVLNGDLPFSARFDGTNPTCTLEVLSIDSAL